MPAVGDPTVVSASRGYELFQVSIVVEARKKLLELGKGNQLSPFGSGSRGDTKSKPNRCEWDQIGQCLPHASSKSNFDDALEVGRGMG